MGNTAVKQRKTLLTTLQQCVQAYDLFAKRYALFPEERDLLARLTGLTAEKFTNDPALLSQTIQEITAKIADIKAHNAKAKDKWFPFLYTKSARALEAALEYVNYHFTRQQDLQEPAKHIIELDEKPLKKSSSLLSELTDLAHNFFARLFNFEQTGDIHKLKNSFKIKNQFFKDEAKKLHLVTPQAALHPSQKKFEAFINNVAVDPEIAFPNLNKDNQKNLKKGTVNHIKLYEAYYKLGIKNKIQHTSLDQIEAILQTNQEVKAETMVTNDMIRQAVASLGLTNSHSNNKKQFGLETINEESSSSSFDNNRISAIPDNSGIHELTLAELKLFTAFHLLFDQHTYQSTYQELYIISQREEFALHGQFKYRLLKEIQDYAAELKNTHNNYIELANKHAQEYKELIEAIQNGQYPNEAERIKVLKPYQGIKSYLEFVLNAILNCEEDDKDEKEKDFNVPTENKIDSSINWVNAAHKNAQYTLNSINSYIVQIKQEKADDSDAYINVLIAELERAKEYITSYLMVLTKIQQNYFKNSIERKNALLPFINAKFYIDFILKMMAKQDTPTSVDYMILADINKNDEQSYQYIKNVINEITNYINHLSEQIPALNSEKNEQVTNLLNLINYLQSAKNDTDVFLTKMEEINGNIISTAKINTQDLLLPYRGIYAYLHYLLNHVVGKLVKLNDNLIKNYNPIQVNLINEDLYKFLTYAIGQTSNSNNKIKFTVEEIISEAKAEEKASKIFVKFASKAMNAVKKPNPKSHPHMPSNLYQIAKKLALKAKMRAIPVDVLQKIEESKQQPVEQQDNTATFLSPRVIRKITHNLLAKNTLVTDSNPSDEFEVNIHKIAVSLYSACELFANPQSFTWWQEYLDNAESIHFLAHEDFKLRLVQQIKCHAENLKSLTLIELNKAKKNAQKQINAIDELVKSYVSQENELRRVRSFEEISLNSMPEKEKAVSKRRSSFQEYNSSTQIKSTITSIIKVANDKVQSTKNMISNCKNLLQHANHLHADNIQPEKNLALDQSMSGIVPSLNSVESSTKLLEECPALQVALQQLNEMVENIKKCVYDIQLPESTINQLIQAATDEEQKISQNYGSKKQPLVNRSRPFHQSIPSEFSSSPRISPFSLRRAPAKPKNEMEVLPEENSSDESETEKLLKSPQL